jgi:hypothetical protein
MLVQVLAMERFPETADDADVCRGNRFDRSLTDRAWPGPLLLWDQVGPDGDGATEVTSTFPVPRGVYDGVCAYAGLRNADPGEPRQTASFLRFHDEP